jgi:hypothetical protein
MTLLKMTENFTLKFLNIHIILLVHFYIFERNMHMREFFGH